MSVEVGMYCADQSVQRQLEENKTWRLVELLSGYRPIGLKGVLKKDAAGNAIHHKARLVVKGYVQHTGVDLATVGTGVDRFAQHTWQKRNLLLLQQS
jgi:hypothetical protein